MEGGTGHWQVDEHWRGCGSPVLGTCCWERPVALETSVASFLKSRGPASPRSAPGDTREDVQSSRAQPCPRPKTIKCPEQNGKIVASSDNILLMPLGEPHHRVRVDSESKKGHNVPEIKRPASAVPKTDRESLQPQSGPWPPRYQTTHRSAKDRVVIEGKPSWGRLLTGSTACQTRVQGLFPGCHPPVRLPDPGSQCEAEPGGT